MSAQNDIPLGLCQCGCGEKTTICPCSNATRGRVRGQPYRYIRGHNNRPTQYVEEDRGFETPCWIWQLVKAKGGYGRGEFGGRMRMAHIGYYERVHGPVPSGHLLHHLCEQPACVNPDHVKPVTRTEHVHLHSRFTWDDIRAIRRRYAAGETNYALAREYGVAKATMRAIVKHRAWKEV